MKTMTSVSSLIMLALFASNAVSAAEGAHAHWGYSGEAGPDHWGTLDPDFSTCAGGLNQSPIDLTGTIEGFLPRLHFLYSPGGTEVVNNGHAIQVNYTSGSTFKVSGHEFELKQFHFHSPSENEIEGRSFPMEAHLVHADPDGNLAVVSVMFEEGEHNPELEKAWSDMPHQVGAKRGLSSPMSAEALLPDPHSYYRYNGSLTTPPCSEGVRWFVMKEYGTMSRAQIDQFTQVMGHPNNRPVQPLNARVVVR